MSPFLDSIENATRVCEEMKAFCLPSRSAVSRTMYGWLGTSVCAGVDGLLRDRLCIRRSPDSHCSLKLGRLLCCISNQQPACTLDDSRYYSPQPTTRAPIVAVIHTPMLSITEQPTLPARHQNDWNFIPMAITSRSARFRTPGS